MIGGVERSVVFIPENVEVILESIPLKGENNKLDEWDEVEDGDEKRKGRRINAENKCLASPKPNETPTSEENTDHLVPATTQQPTIEHEPVLKGQGHHICKESAYIRQIWEGAGHTSNLANSQAMPLGIQVVDEETPNEHGGLADEWEIDEEVEFAMAIVMDAMEGLNPTYDEAKKWADWPKWKEAIDVEFKALEDNGLGSLLNTQKASTLLTAKLFFVSRRMRLEKSTNTRHD